MLVFVLLASLVTADTVHRTEEDERCNRTVEIYQAVSSPPVTATNRNKPLHCVYRIRVRPARNDWVVFVRFTRMRVGEPSPDRTRCVGGHVQIVDGYRDSNHSNRLEPGFYCGEIDSPKTFVSETPHVKIVLHVDSYDGSTYLQFDANVEQQQEVHARYGQYSQLYPHRRGTPVHGQYCERTYRSCAPTRCFVQSPGFPGVYPRNLQCRYSLLAGGEGSVALDMDAFDVDGLRCDNLLLCFPRPVTRQADQCPFDFVKVYDGPTADSPLIVTLCGRGRLKSQIVASGPEMLVEFVTSAAGPLLNTGFHFKAETVYRLAEREYEFVQLNSSNGSCAIDRRLKNSSQMFGSLRSWYPPNTTCTYRFQTSENEIVRLTFHFFKTERFTLCEESLRIYDAPFADPNKILSKLCDIKRPRTDPPKSVYQSTGPDLFIVFSSKIGSLEGSSIRYAFEVKPVSTILQRKSQPNKTCSRTYTDMSGDMSSFSNVIHDHINTTASNRIRCNYTFDASALPHGRVALEIYTVLHSAEDCSDCYKEPLYMEVLLGLGNRLCFCKVSTHHKHNIYSTSSKLELRIYSEVTPREKKFSHKQILNGSYVLFTDTRCGPEKLELDTQGVFVFPNYPYDVGTCPLDRCQEESIFCTWKIPVFFRMDLMVKIEGLPGNANCSSDRAVVNGIVVCPTTSDNEVLLRQEDILSDVTVSLRLSSFDDQSSNVTLQWTQLRMLPSQHSSDTLVSLGKDCDFLCTSSMACLTRELVCNGLGNCPGSSLETPADEDPSLCVAPQDRFKLFWWVVGFGVGICTCLTSCLVFAVCRKCRGGTHRI